MRRAARIDATQNEIAEVLKAFGCQILYLHQVGGGCPDLLVRKRSRSRIHGGFVTWNELVLVECKTRTGKLRQAQQDLIDAGWPIVVLRSADEALAWLKG